MLLLSDSIAFYINNSFKKQNVEKLEIVKFYSFFKKSPQFVTYNLWFLANFI